ncbi:hypothetical protein QR680_011662 [Steinernema hermaphroditum]|uniref:C-type lectin domain-containing protein n=1 Tax=Steinernema hermaphroditum TaxID=289476 RepID=A0AA39LZC0_9BILA|nr:hypothetical protein QR680_011662 [Steinernema hermaphroditum]
MGILAPFVPLLLSFILAKAELHARELPKGQYFTGKVSLTLTNMESADDCFQELYFEPIDGVNFDATTQTCYGLERICGLSTAEEGQTSFLLNHDSDAMCALDAKDAVNKAVAAHESSGSLRYTKIKEQIGGNYKEKKVETKLDCLREAKQQQFLAYAMTSSDKCLLFETISKFEQQAPCDAAPGKICPSFYLVDYRKIPSSECQVNDESALDVVKGSSECKKDDVLCTKLIRLHTTCHQANPQLIDCECPTGTEKKGEYTGKAVCCPPEMELSRDTHCSPKGFVYSTIYGKYIGSVNFAAKKPQTQPEMNQLCFNVKATPAKISNEKENAELLKLVGAFSTIGLQIPTGTPERKLHTTTDGMEFRWVSDNTDTKGYSNWYPSQPNNGNGGNEAKAELHARELPKGQYFTGKVSLTLTNMESADDCFQDLYFEPIDGVNFDATTQTCYGLERICGLSAAGEGQTSFLLNHDSDAMCALDAKDAVNKAVAAHESSGSLRYTKIKEQIGGNYKEKKVETKLDCLREAKQQQFLAYAMTSSDKCLLFETISKFEQQAPCEASIGKICPSFYLVDYRKIPSSECHVNDESALDVVKGSSECKKDDVLCTKLIRLHTTCHQANPQLIDCECPTGTEKKGEYTGKAVCCPPEMELSRDTHCSPKGFVYSTIYGKYIGSVNFAAKKPQTQPEMNQLCFNVKATPAKISNEKENAELLKLVGAFSTIGLQIPTGTPERKLHTTTDGMEFRWVSDNTDTKGYSNWYPSQPNNGNGGNEIFVRINDKGQWEDVNVLFIGSRIACMTDGVNGLQD